ncbi:hypothetical protein WBP07_21140 (plasmid) [Novosphingobium sp. BL-8A]|uniref:hypothetical protein n=1 Tax=Novosphingobium sp. BL-8A TaxID=3127639 RepID=UPI003757C2F4
MAEVLREVLQYYGAGAAVVASMIVSLNVGSQWTGRAMLIYVSSSICLIAWGFLNPDSEGIGWQNVILLAINLVGVWRYVLTPPADRKRSAVHAANSDRPT